MKTIALLLRMCLLTMEPVPDWMMAAAARVGSRAHHPGYRLYSLRKHAARRIVSSPKADRA